MTNDEYLALVDYIKDRNKVLEEESKNKNANQLNILAKMCALTEILKLLNFYYKYKTKKK